MPNIRQYGIEVDVDLDIDVDEFLDDCSEQEIKQVVDWLKENDYLQDAKQSSNQDNILDLEYKKMLDKLYNKRVYLTIEEETFLTNLANKF